MNDRITFLGTGGARMVMSNQVLSTGGIILEMKDCMLSIDPGPGAIVRTAKEKVNIDKLDGIIISHRHLDHCGDVNVMVEAMTRGGYRRKGTIFAPKQALDDDPVILQYLRDFVEEVKVIEARSIYKCRSLSFETSMPHHHAGVETYGFLFYGSHNTIAYLPDTKYFNGLARFYSSDLCIISTLLLNRGRVDHLSVPDVMVLVKEINPKVAVLTHFGLQIWRSGVDNAADKISQATGIKVVAAKDGMELDVDKLLGNFK